MLHTNSRYLLRDDRRYLSAKLKIRGENPLFSRLRLAAYLISWPTCLRVYVPRITGFAGEYRFTPVT